MKIEWDESKRQENIKKHKIDFKDILSVFEAELLEWVDNRVDYGEEQIIALGQFREHRVLVLVFVEKGTDVIRIISARKANKHEREKFYLYQAQAYGRQ